MGTVVILPLGPVVRIKRGNIGTAWPAPSSGDLYHSSLDVCFAVHLFESTQSDKPTASENTMITERKLL